MDAMSSHACWEVTNGCCEVINGCMWGMQKYSNFADISKSQGYVKIWTFSRTLKISSKFEDIINIWRDHQNLEISSKFEDIIKNWRYSQNWAIRSKFWRSQDTGRALLWFDASGTKSQGLHISVLRRGPSPRENTIVGLRTWTPLQGSASTLAGCCTLTSYPLCW